MGTYEQRAYQEEAIASCAAAFGERGRESVLLESPVGSGKTYIALETIHRFQEKLGRRLTVNWVAPRRRLLQQMMEANRDLYQDDIRAVSLFDRNPPGADFVVLDEAHHEATQSCVLLYEKMRHSWTMGLSATPLRTDRMKLSFQETVRTCSIARLIREGYLSPFNSFLIPEYTVDTVADHYLADPARWGKSLVFFSTIAECVAFRERLRLGGVACEVVTGESDKDAQMEVFARGAVPVIANVAMLTEGFDQPDVQSVFARDASRLPSIQMCGRGLRKAPGKEACNIVQSANSLYLFERVAPPKNAFRWQQERWLALKDGTAEIEETLKETLRRIAERHRRDRKERKADYQRAAREAPGRFARKLERIARAEKLERDFYERFGGVYDALQRFYQTVNVACWGGQLPPCAIHLDKSYNTSKARAGLVRNFVRDGDRVHPALVVHLRTCYKLRARRLAIALLREMARLNGSADADETHIASELELLGYNEAGNCYRRGSPFGVVMDAADTVLAPVMPRLCCALDDLYAGTEKGDGAYFLKQMKDLEVNVPADVV